MGASGLSGPPQRTEWTNRLARRSGTSPNGRGHLAENVRCRLHCKPKPTFLAENVSVYGRVDVHAARLCHFPEDFIVAFHGLRQ
jgi:hypothetical protein